MNIQVDRSRINRVIVICKGKLDSANAPMLEKAVLPIIKEKNRPIVLDLAMVNHISNVGVQVLEYLFKQANQIQYESLNKTGLLRIGNMSSDVRDLLCMKGLLLQMTHQFSYPAEVPLDESTYEELIVTIRDFFPTPVSNRVKDAYFLQLINQSLQNIDQLKTSRPFWGEKQVIDYEAVKDSKVPESISTLEDVISELSSYFNGRLNPGHPKVQQNVHPPATIASIIGQLFGAIGNANLVMDGYSQKFAEAEIEASSICANLIGYNSEKSGGIFTFSGTGTILYGAKIGIEKALPGSFSEGIQQPAKIICSNVAHYSSLSTIGWLGLGTKNLITVATDNDNSMDLKALEQIMHDLLQKGEKIACIVATMGTTDAFGIDNLEYIVRLRDELVEQYQLSYKPHIHADAVIGWAFAVFNDYDFDKNSMAFSPRTLHSLWDVRHKILSLNLADSVGIDFHKTGYTCYTSSLFLCKNFEDLSLVSRDKKSMPYLFDSGKYHPGTFTLEVSRAAGPVLSALANLKLLGKNGYRAILGHIVTMAGKLRSRIERVQYACILNDYDQGSGTLFRVYPDGVDAKSAYLEEFTHPEFAEQLVIHNEYNRKIFIALQQQVENGFGIALSLTERYRMTSYGEPIVALKSYIMSPFVDAEVMETLFSCLEEARSTVSLLDSQPDEYLVR